MADLTPSSQTNDTANLALRVKQLSILHEIARAVTSVLDLQSVLNRIVDAAVYLTDAEEGSLMLVDKETGSLLMRAGRALGDKGAKVMRVPANDGLSGQVLRTGQPLRMGGRENSKSNNIKSGYVIKSVLKVPIKGQDQVLGVLSVDHAIESFETFSDYDVNLMTSLADYATIAIENAQRYEEATQRANALSQALKDVGVTPITPSRQTDREALHKFNEGLRLQREEVAIAQREVQALAQELRSKADIAATIADQLGLWNDQTASLMPHLDWIAQTALMQNTKPSVPAAIDQTQVASIADLLLDHLQEGILLCNAKGEVLQVSASAAKILALPKDEILHQPLQRLFPNDAHWEHLVGSLRLAISLSDNSMAVPPTSSATFYQDEKVIQATILPLQQPHNQSMAIIAIIRDLSLEMKGWRVRDKTVNDLSESLRTPLAFIHGYTDMLLNESVGLITSAQRRFLERVRSGVDQMEAVLMNFVVQLTNDLVKAQTEHSTMQAALEAAIDAAREQLTLAGVELSVEIDQDLSSLPISPEFFTRIMTDLLVRAGSHAQPGSIIQLTTTAQTTTDQPEYLVINIAHQAVNEAISQQIKEDNDLKAIAKAVQYQGGRIWVEIAPQGQWLISFLLPVAD